MKFKTQQTERKENKLVKAGLEIPTTSTSFS